MARRRRGCGGTDRYRSGSRNKNKDEEDSAMGDTDGKVINVNRLIDDGPVRPFQVFAISLCALVAFLDGADTQSIAVAAPIIADNLKLTRAALGPLFSAALLGSAARRPAFWRLPRSFRRAAAAPWWRA